MSATNLHPHIDKLPRAAYYPDPDRVVQLERMADGITELVAHLDAGTFLLLELICEFDKNEGWSGPGIQSCAHWLNWKCGMSQSSARERVRVARALPLLPEISAAFAQGRVSLDVSAEISSKQPLDRTSPEPAAQKRADELARVVEGFLAGIKKGPSGGDRYMLNIHTDIETLKQDGTGAGSEPGSVVFS